jgi:hypothetical protein
LIGGNLTRKDFISFSLAKGKKLSPFGEGKLLEGVGKF